MNLINLVIINTTETELKNQTAKSIAFNNVAGWMNRYQLVLAPGKTEAILLIGRKKAET